MECKLRICWDHYAEIRWLLFTKLYNNLVLVRSALSLALGCPLAGIFYSNHIQCGLCFDKFYLFETLLASENQIFLFTHPSKTKTSNKLHYCACFIQLFSKPG